MSYTRRATIDMGAIIGHGYQVAYITAANSNIGDLNDDIVLVLDLRKWTVF